MTRIEKAYEIECAKCSGLSKREIKVRHCPDHYGFMDQSECPAENEKVKLDDCFYDCWEREVSEVDDND
jgi:hypothetical protein